MATLQIKTSPAFIQEKSYVFEVLLSELLGINYSLEVWPNQYYSLSYAGKEIRLPDFLFVGETNSISDLQYRIKSKIEYAQFDLLGMMLPFPKMLDDSLLSLWNSRGVSFTRPVDIIGTAFFFLTLFEEAFEPRRDFAGRCNYFFLPSSKQGLRDWPFVNIAAELLYKDLNEVFAFLRKPRRFKVHLSHDIDNPVYSYLPWATKLRQFGSFAKRGEYRLLYHMAKAAVNRQGSDPFDTFDFLMDVSEAAGLQSEFFFIAREHGTDPRYNLRDPLVLRAIRRIIERGHEIGLHASYDSYRNLPYLREELQELRDVLALTGGAFSGACRQHYLRFDPLETWLEQEAVGIDVDSSVYFPEKPGFRAGICQEYPVYSLKERRKLNLREQPLLIMEASFLESEFGSPGYPSLLTVSKEIAERTKLFNGDFTVLWHNDRLLNSDAKTAYTDLVRNSSDLRSFPLISKKRNDL
jgi:hypothetical protein